MAIAITAATPSLAGRVALVTGGSRGIGRAISQRLAAHGARIVVTASPRSIEGLRQTCESILRRGGHASWVAADLADADARADLIARATQPFGPIDILVNNAAAITAYAPPSRIDLAARQAMFEINLQAPVDLIQQALLDMCRNGWGRILNISSETTRQPTPPYPGPAKWVHALTAYGASKAALDRYTLGLAAELDGTGVQVNALMPYRIVRTESAAGVADQMRASHPDWVEPVEMMAEAAYRLIDRAVTGQIVVSRAWLQQQKMPVLGLDGATLMGDADDLFA